MLCDFANEKGMKGFLHPVIRAILLHFWITYDHPFLDGNDLNYFLSHKLEVICVSINPLKESIRRKHEESESLRRNLGAGGDFNHRQIALLKRALKHPCATYTVVSHQNSHGISNQTAKNDLTALEAKELLQRGKSGKAFVHSPSADLAEKLGL